MNNRAGAPKEALAAYVLGGGRRCFVCNSGDLDVQGEAREEAGELVRKVSCAGCGARWEEHFVLSWVREF